jgi:hypothetical protein
MEPQTVDQRLESLEVRVPRLEERLDALVVEVADMRVEMRAGFAAVRREAAGESERLRTDLRGYGDGLFAMAKEHIDKRHNEARALHEEVIDRLKKIKNR